MMRKSLGFVVGLLILNGLTNTASCTSTSTSHGAGGTDSTSSTGAGGSAGADSTDAAAGGSGFGGSTSMGGSIGTGTSTGGGTGGSVGTNGGSRGTTPVAMNCGADDPDCTCDDTGCYLVDGAGCVQASACKSQNCGVTQDNDSVCCADACGTVEVCAADGSGCEPAEDCEDDQARCSAEGDYQLCEGGAWTTIEPCDGRGCSTELDGCLLGVGDGCDDDDECGEGTCQETPDGSSVCCDLSCGECQVCSTDGASCEYPETTKPECECSSDAECSDNRDCTSDVCTDGVCSNEVVSGTCLIDGECYEHNQPEPNNSCRYCDAANKNRGWTNSSNSVSCDDGLYCNGNDTCNGVGACQHQFPTNDRCTEDGPCALTECDEERDSCYEPAGTQCLSQTEKRCEAGCSGDVQSRTVTASCTGNSPDCTGTPTNPAFVDSTPCSSTQACNSSTFTCETTLECTDEAWCDPSPGGQCWTLDEPEFMSQPDAIDYCDDLTLAGADWHLPSIEEWFALSKGCDGRTGTPEDADFQSTCVWDGANYGPDCQACPSGEGPGNGCYWSPAMGSCLMEVPWYYWSSTETPLSLYFSPMDTYSYFSGTDALLAVRCATGRP